MNESAGEERLDGRQSRTLRSRRALCEACLDLVQEGVLQPSADQIAERAGLSRRSVFNHFSDLSALYDDVVEAGLRRCAPLRRSMAVSALVGPVRSEAVRVGRALQTQQRDEIAALFAPELARLEATDRAELVEALTAAVSPANWEHLRASRGLSLARARSVMQRSLQALLRDAGVSR